MPELPKLSQFTNMLRMPEQQFESTVESTTGTSVPKGPQSVILSVQKDVEAGEAPTPPTPEAAGLPKLELPTLPFGEGASPFGESSPEEETEFSSEEEAGSSPEEIGTPKEAGLPVSGGTTEAETQEALESWKEKEGTKIKFA